MKAYVRTLLAITLYIVMLTAAGVVITHKVSGLIQTHLINMEAAK